jgi:hypothetical protein
MDWFPPIKTFGEILPECMIELVSGGPSQTSLKLLLWDGTNSKILPRVSIEPLPDWGFSTNVFEPPDIDSSILRAIRFPTHAAPPSSQGELFVEVRNLIMQYTGLPDDLGRLLTYCVFASWFSDCTPISICVSIIGPESRQGWHLFRLLSCLFRRALVLSDVNLSGLCSLPTGLFPALFLEQHELSTQSEKVLHALNTRGTFIPWKGRLVNLCWPKVIRSERPLSNRALGERAIVIPVEPGWMLLPILDPQTQQDIANRLQPKLLRYRLINFRRIAKAIGDFPTLEEPLREVACCLSNCVPEMPGVQEEMASLFEERNRQVQSDCENDPNFIVVQAMLSFCHQADTETVRVAEVASAVNVILEQEGEMLELSPKAVGGRLELLSLNTKRIDAKSRGMLLTDARRKLIHKRAWEYGVTETRDTQRCEYCKHFAQLEVERTQPYNPCKIFESLSQPEEAPSQPPVQPEISRGPLSDQDKIFETLDEPKEAPGQPPVRPMKNIAQFSDQSRDIGSPRWVEDQDDRDIIDKLEEDNKF